MSHDPEDCIAHHIAATGARFTVEWARDAEERMPARDFFLSLSGKEQVKLIARFQRLAAIGRISNDEIFKKVADLWEFKSGDLRFLGDFRPGGKFILAHGTRKKKRRLDREDMEVATRRLREHDAREERSTGRPHTGGV